MKRIIVLMWSLIESVCYRVIKFVFGIFHRDLSEGFYNTVLQFIKFGIVGLSNTVISYVIYVICLLIFKKVNFLSSIDYVIAQFISFTLSVLWSFYWNNKIVFVNKTGKKSSIWKKILKVYISYSFTGLFLNSILLVLWIHMLGISEFVAPIINLVISVPINFIINKFWAFKS